MRWPRKGILIRLLIWPPILGYAVWSAFFREREPAPPPVVEQPVGKKRTIEGPDGKTFQIIELTPEEYEAQYGEPPPAAP